jgi:hypothetical protein
MAGCAARQPGFAVYRNTVLKGCIDALQANYPTVHALVGDRMAARRGTCLRARSTRRRTGDSWAMARALPIFWKALARPPTCPTWAPWRGWTAAGPKSHLAADAPTLQATWLAQQTA